MVRVIRPHTDGFPGVVLERGSATRSWWAVRRAGMGEVHQVSIYCNLSQFARLSEWESDCGGIVPECLPRQSKSKAVRGDQLRDGRGSGKIGGQLNAADG